MCCCAHQHLSPVSFRLHGEVDFVLTHEGQSSKELMQVCADFDAPETCERELKALFEAMNELGISRSVIITMDKKKVGHTKNDGAHSIRFVSAVDWFLSP